MRLECSAAYGGLESPVVRYVSSLSHIVAVPSHTRAIVRSWFVRISPRPHMVLSYL